MTKLPAEIVRPEPRWPAIVSAFAAVALHFALPAQLRIDPPWILAGVVVSLIVLANIARRRGQHRLNGFLAYMVLATLTVGLLFGVLQLILALVNHTAMAIDLLKSAATLWATNVIVFANLYWRLDGGGPNERERLEAHVTGAFLFPQMTFVPHGESRTLAASEGWRPHFVDYLFVAFNTSTAFSPTDAPVLTIWAKLAMMVQAIISFTTVVLIAARAVNIL
jgi:hypothetical protein